MSLLFNMLLRFVITFLSESKHLLISWLLSLSAVILETKKMKSVTVSTFFPICLPWVMRLDAMIFIFECQMLNQLFHCPLSPSSKGSLVPPHFLLLEWYYLPIWGFLYFSSKSSFQLVIHSAQHFVWCNLNRS